MTMLTISDAARLAGVSRQTLYDRINSGTLSRTSDGVDLAELARVYPELEQLTDLQIKSVVKKDEKKPVEKDSDSAELIALREREVEWLKEELAKRDEQIAAKDALLAKQAERMYDKDSQWQDQMTGLRDSFENNLQRLLEGPEPEPKKKFLGIF